MANIPSAESREGNDSACHAEFGHAIIKRSEGACRMAGSVSENAADHEIEWREQTRKMLMALPAEFEQARTRLVELSDGFRNDLAQAFQVRLNEHLKGLPQRSYAEKKAVASFVNHELHELGLVIKCPKTGKPAILVADIKDGHNSEISRFRLEVRDDRGRQLRTQTSTRLFELELMGARPRKEGLARWDRKPDDRPR